MDALLTEIRFALCRLARNPSFSILVILTLALGIGATTTIFSVVNGVLLRELPYPDPGRLIQVRTHHKGRISDTNSAANFLDYREQIESIDSVTFYQYRRWYLGETKEPRYVLGAVSSYEFFEVMGVAPALGRPFTPDDERPDADVVVISHGFWQSHFGGLADVIGRTVLLDARPFSVVGVMPAGFGFPNPEVEIWRPLWLDPTNPNLRSDNNLLVVARLAKGASLTEAQHEFTAYGERVADQYPQNYKTFQFAVSAVSLRTATVGTVQTPLVVLLGAVAFVLLIACANVANLLLVRYEARGYELAVRSALGASRARIVRQMLVESLVLALAGGLIGLALTKLGLSGLLSLAGDAIPRADNVRLDFPVLALTIAVSVLAGLLAGSLPSIRISAKQPGQMLCAGGRSVIAGGRSVLRRSLVIAEVALAGMLVIGAFLMIRTLAALYDVDVGFRTDKVLTARVTLPQDGYRNLALVGDFFRSLEERVRALPGVREVGTAWRLPLATGYDNLSIVIEGHEVATVGEAPTAQVQVASPGYFDALGLTPIQGRTFKASDSVGRPFVAVVNRTFERQLLDGQQAVGTLVKLWGDDMPWVEIVGVVGDIHNDDLVTDPRPTVHFAHAQLLMDEIRPEDYLARIARNMALVVHTDGDPAAIAGSVREIVRQLDPSVPVSDIRTMAEILAAAQAGHRFPTVLFVVFGVVALALSITGVYGVVAYAANRRSHEIGIRMALGADTAEVRRMMVLHGLTPAGLGLLFGMLGAAVSSRAMTSLLFNVHALDPGTFIAVAFLIAAAAAVASYIPARRASRVDPCTVLWSE